MTRRHAALGHRPGPRNEIGARTLKPADRDSGLIVKAIRHFSPPATVTRFALPEHHLGRRELVAHHLRSIAGRAQGAHEFAMFNMLNLLARGAESPQDY